MPCFVRTQRVSTYLIGASPNLELPEHLERWVTRALFEVSDDSRWPLLRERFLSCQRIAQLKLCARASNLKKKTKPLRLDLRGDMVPFFARPWVQKSQTSPSTSWGFSSPKEKQSDVRSPVHSLCQIQTKTVGQQTFPHNRIRPVWACVCKFQFLSLSAAFFQL